MGNDEKTKADLNKPTQRVIILSNHDSKKLVNLFTYFESYLTTIFMPIENNFDPNLQSNNFKYSGDLPDLQNTSIKEEKKINRQNTAEFFTCPLCCHCLIEPVTLVCGCSFCKNCLTEYNSMQTNANIKDELKKITV